VPVDAKSLGNSVGLLAFGGLSGDLLPKLDRKPRPSALGLSAGMSALMIAALKAANWMLLGTKGRFGLMRCDAATECQITIGSCRHAE
jgi:hypothetical protein